jgi:diguanylate cyclase (GGDEF)-like protein/PAS domain S-box-containing protein
MKHLPSQIAHFPAPASGLERDQIDRRQAIPELSEAERALLPSPQQAQQILSGMPSGLMLLDAQSKVCAANPALLQLFSRDHKQLQRGTPLSSLLPEPHLLEEIEQLRAAGCATTPRIVTLATATAIRHLEISLCRSNPDQDIAALLAQDVSERVDTEQRLQQIRNGIDGSRDSFYLVDVVQMRIIDANRTASLTLGYSHEELLALGPQHLQAEPVDIDLLRQNYQRILQSGSGIIETVQKRKDGSALPVEMHLCPVGAESRPVMAMHVRDITDRLQASEALRESEDRFHLIFNQAAVGLAHVGLDGRWLRVNQKLCAITGYSEQELLNLRFQQHTHPDDLITDLEQIQHLLSGDIQNYSKEKRYIHKDGHFLWVNLNVSLVRDDAGQPKYLISVIEEISQRKRVEGELQHLAHYDALTGLPNRSLLQYRLAQAIAHAKRSGQQMAVIVIDIDHFNHINDSLGQDAGDQILIEIGRRLCSGMRDGDTVARQGGDDFIMVLSDVTDEESVMLSTSHMLAELGRPLPIQEHVIYPTGSIGISLYPKDGEDSHTLLKNAESAMYQAQNAGGNNFQFYAQEMNASTLDRLKLEAGLRRALECNEFVLHYQPQLEIETGRIVGVEALVRWQPPGQEAVQPANFIGLAEENGLILPIGLWVLHTACAQSKAWQDAGLPSIRMAVNISARQFKQLDIVEVVSQALQQTGCSPASLELEMTESVIIENAEAAVTTMRQLNQMGVHLSIDDFGTGYSSLSYLKRFPIGLLKIDQSFVRDITTDSDDAAIVKAIIALAHSMKLKVIAEGVENVEQLAFLRQQNCDQMQGYYFSRPLPAAQVESLLANGANLDQV